MTEVKERPIIMSAESVRAILEGRKTQTRRVVKQDAITKAGILGLMAGTGPAFGSCPYGVPGDRLWVKETWWVEPEFWQKDHGPQPIHYDANVNDPRQIEDYEKKPSIFMPRWASRLTLEITDVRVERVQEISFKDCQAEGCDSAWRIAVPDCPHPFCSGWHYGEKYHFQHIWDSLNAKRGYAWETNPWVWAVTFRLLGGSDGNVGA